MAIDARFFNDANLFGSILSQELDRHFDIRTYKDYRWRDYNGKMRLMFDVMGTDILRWTVAAIRRQNRENSLPYNHPRRFEEVAREILKNSPSLNSDCSVLTPKGSDYSLFLTQVKDNIILPALHSRPSGHLRLV